MILNPLKWAIPPQVRLAIAAAPWVAIAALAMYALWQRADVVAALASRDAADIEKQAAQRDTAIAVASNKVLTELISRAAAAERWHAREIQRITTTVEKERHANHQIPIGGCFDARLPDAAIGLYRVAPGSVPAGIDRDTGAGGAGTSEHP